MPSGGGPAARTRNPEDAMARQPRLKIFGESAWYHLYARTVAYQGEYPLERSGVREAVLSLFRRYALAYMCEVASFCILGNHYHFVVRFEAFRELSREELRRRALLLYEEKELESWDEKRWKRFNRRIFDVSELMRNVNSASARWYNRRFGRKGALWQDRFKSSLLASPQAVAECMLYVDLNPVRAGLCRLPEQWAFCSWRQRCSGRDGWLMPLEEAIGRPAGALSAAGRYRTWLLLRGTEPGKEGDGRIPRALADRELADARMPRGAYLRKQRFFTDGLVVGSCGEVAGWLGELRRRGVYRRRSKPIPQAEGSIYSLREQRSHFVE